MFMVARIIGYFGATLSKTLTLSVVIPGLIYCSNALGAHADSIVMRGISMGLNVRLKLRREALAGLLGSLGAVVTLYTAPASSLTDINLALLITPSLLFPEVFGSPFAERIPLLSGFGARNSDAGSGKKDYNHCLTTTPITVINTP
ncbi:MAG: hypothetical protein V4628_16930 [Pseudomonadota bacterium]